MSCYLNQVQSCADCIQNNEICRLFPPAWVSSQMQAQIDEINKTLQELQQERMRETIRNEQDVMAYHMGMTEVIDVDPIGSSRERRTR